jgi:GcrA cell cycle regulator
MDWTHERMNRLRDLWEAGTPVIEIRAEFKVSKNTIAGKVHRLGLQPRANPVRYDGVRGEEWQRHLDAAKRRETRALTAVSGPAPEAAAPPPIFPTRTCAWPLWGDRERATQLFCGAPTLRGVSWCAEHLRIVKGKGR